MGPSVAFEDTVLKHWLFLKKIFAGLNQILVLGNLEHFVSVSLFRVKRSIVDQLVCFFHFRKYMSPMLFFNSQNGNLQFYVGYRVENLPHRRSSAV